MVRPRKLLHMAIGELVGVNFAEGACSLLPAIYMLACNLRPLGNAFVTLQMV